ncbi:MAG TPA: YHS domain-containing protein [Fimbriimonadaceae bacterium]|nr:YHS domain-containing protein [Fimbriimonadaceae bacterium]
MNKTIALIAIFSLALTGAFAGQKTKTKQAKTPTTIGCAVLGTPVNIAKATKDHMYADYKGNRYFFCCGGCPDTFKKNPAKYASKPHIKTPAAKKAK